MSQDAAPTDEDPAYNPALLPPRTRADVVQDRPAGGTPEEVAAANPALAAAVPETVGAVSIGEAGGSGKAHVLANQSASSDTAQPGGVQAGEQRHPDPAQKKGQTGGAEAATTSDTDGSGIEMPELAVQQGWTH